MHSRSIRILTSGLLLAFACGNGFAADQPAKTTTAVTDLIPADACAAIAVANLKELRTKGDKFLAETKARVPLRPSQAFAMALVGIGIKQGLDESGSAAVIFVNLKAIGRRKADFRALEDGIVVVAPFTQLDKMAANYQIPPKDLLGGKVVEKKVDPKRWMGSHFAVRGKHLVIGNTEAAVRSVLTSAPLSRELVASQRAAFAKTEVLFHLGTTSWGEDWDRLRKSLEKELDSKDDKPESRLIRQLGGAISSLKFGLIGMRLENGLAFNVLAQFEPDPTARKVLKQIAGNPGTADLAGLPIGDVVTAFAINGPGSTAVPLAEAIVGTALKLFVSTKKLVSPANRPALVGIFGEVWHRLKGSRAAMYRNPTGSRYGPYSLVAILDTGDSKKFLAELRELALFVNRAGMKLSSEPGKGINKATVRKLIAELGHDRYRVRTAAMVKLNLIGAPALPFLENALKTSKDPETRARARQLQKRILAVAAEQRKVSFQQDLLTRLKPRFVYNPASERRKGQLVDIIHLKLAKNDISAAPSLRAVFGNDWDKIRLATIGNQAVVLLGSNTDLFEKTLVNVLQRKPGLAAHEAFGRFRKMRDAHSKLEFHLSIVEASTAITAKQPKTPKIPPRREHGLSALSMSAGSDHLRIDVQFSLSDVAAVLRHWW